MLRLERHPLGLRAWILGHRWHHAHAGLALVAIGLELIISDRRDVLSWLRSFRHGNSDSSAA